MGTESTGYMNRAGLEKMVLGAERIDDIKIRLEGLQIGKEYYIRQACTRAKKSMFNVETLETGFYTIACLDCFHGIPTLHDRTAFKVDGDNTWHTLTENLIFSYID